MPENKRRQNNPSKKDFIDDSIKSVKEEFAKTEFSKFISGTKEKFLKFISSFKNFENLAKTNYEIGRKCYESKEFSDAIFRFRFVTWWVPKHYNAWYLLGASYIANGQSVKGRNALRNALKIKPDFVEADSLLRESVASK